MAEPIRQVYGDGRKEKLVADWLAANFRWELYPTPKFYFMDFLVNQIKEGGYANFIGGLEVKWLNKSINDEVKFPLQKLQKMWLTEPVDDEPQAFNRICIRYNDGVLLAPASAFRHGRPIYGLTRADTNEHDFNVVFTAAHDLTRYIINAVINE
jgi:hypothetical protein